MLFIKMSNNIYYFTASWCGPCKAIAEDIQKLNEQYEDIDFYKLDVDDEENQEICDKYKISSIPSFLIFKEGNHVSKFSGANVSGLQELINETFFLN